MNYFLVSAKREVRFEYIWFLEFQKRGAPHIHMFLDIYPESDIREFFAGLWAWRVVDCPAKKNGEFTKDYLKVFRVHKHPSAWEKIRHPEGAARYAIKYATKSSQKKVPENFTNVGRFWGASQQARQWSREEKVIEIDVSTDEEVRKYLDKKGRNMDNFDVLPGIIFIPIE